MKHIIFLLICLSFIFSEINFSGDARIRPRLDIKDYGPEKSSIDLYYLYRARLNIDADIGSGWFFKSKLGTNDVAGMTKMGKDNTKYVYIDKDKSDYFIKSDEPGSFNSSRPKLSFLNLYYGLKREKFGIWGGAFSLKSSPSLDIHFYPDKMVDIPWALFNNESTTGFAGYIGLVNWFISIDGNQIEIENKSKRIDPFTVGFDFSMNWNEIMKTIRPRGIFSISNKDEPWPMTFGLDINFVEFFKINSMLSYYYTGQTINKEYKYTGNHLRIKFDRKLGPGKLTFWSDIASHICQKSNIEEENRTDFFYIWLDYNYNVFNSDFGSISIKPTIRILNQKNTDVNYTRMKIELTTGIKFK